MSSLYGGTLVNGVLSISAANLSANLDGVQAQVSLGNIISIVLTDPGVPDLALTSAQIRQQSAQNDRGALALISTAYHPQVAVQDALIAAALGNMAQTVDILDSPAAVLAGIEALQKIGGIRSISFTGGGTPNFAINAADIGAFAAVTGNYSLSVWASAAQVSSKGWPGNANVTSVTVVDSAANIDANLDTLEALEKTGKLAGITLTDAKRTPLAVTPAQLQTDADALGMVHFAASSLTPVAHVNGTLLDFDGQRVLFSPANAPGSIDIHTISSNSDTVIAGVANETVVQGALVSGGALFLCEGQDVLANSLLLDVNGNLTNEGFLNSLHSLRVAGNFAEWSNGTSLYLLDVTSNVGKVLLNGSYGNWMNDVTAQGVVAAWTSGTYDVVSINGGTVTTIAGSPLTWNIYVRTDGTSYLYLTQTASSGPDYSTLVLERNGVAIPLLTDLAFGYNRASAGSPDLTYRINNGWVAYIDQGLLYEIAPNSVTPVPVTLGATSLVALGADGSIAYQSSGTTSGLSIAIPGANGDTIYNLGAFTQAWNIAGTWYVSDGTTIDQFTPGAAQALALSVTNGAAPVTYTLASNVDTFTVTGSGNATVTGNALFDTLTGGNGDDTLIAGSAGGVYNGGGGEHNVLVVNASSTVSTITHKADNSWTIAGPGFVDTVTNIEVARFTDRTMALREATPADFTGSGTSDLLLRDTSSGAVSAWTLSGGGFAGSTQIGGLPANVDIAGTGDFDGDGTSDLLLRDESTGAVSFWAMSSGGFAGSTQIGGLPASVQIAGVGDFTGSGTSDILLRDESTGAVSFWAIQNGQFAGTHPLGGLPANVEIAGVGDFNGDGVSDLLLRDTSTGAVSDWTINPDGSFGASHQLGGLPANVQIAGIGDFNGDGTSDLLLRDMSTGAVSTWLISANTLLASRQIGGLPSTIDIAGIRDVNGDGFADILLRDTTTGGISAWTMNNGAYSGSVAIGGAGANYTLPGG